MRRIILAFAALVAVLFAGNAAQAQLIVSTPYTGTYSSGYLSVSPSTVYVTPSVSYYGSYYPAYTYSSYYSTPYTYGTYYGAPYTYGSYYYPTYSSGYYYPSSYYYDSYPRWSTRWRTARYWR